MPDFPAPQIILPNVPRAELIADSDPSCHMWAQTQFEIIKKYIREFEATLDPDHEVGVLFTNFGQSVLMQVTRITYEESVLMVFKGFVNGREATLIQHINQLNFLLTTMEKAEPDKPKRPIGFTVRDDDDEEEEEEKKA